jgi:hypothetical protein
MAVKDLSGLTQVKFDVYSSRTGSNLKFGLNNKNFISNASIDDEDMADITDWSDGDNGTGATSSQVTFDSKSCMKLDSGNAAVGNFAYRYQDIGSVGSSTVVSFSAYFDTVEANFNNNWFRFEVADGTHLFSSGFAGDTLAVINSSGTYTAVSGTSGLVVADTWQEWTFKITWGASATVDIYKDKILIASGVDCAYDNAIANGFTSFLQFGYSTANRITYIDWFKAGSDFGGTTTTTETTPNITSANAWQTVTWDISAVADASKNNIDQFIITVANADSDNTFYVDNVFANPTQLFGWLDREIPAQNDVFGMVS